MNKVLFSLALTALAIASNAAVRQTSNINSWEFSHDGKSWEQVTVPHDWAIAGPFDKHNDMQCVAIVQNGETIATEKTGRTGALPWIGEGFYRTTINIPAGYGHAELMFDGAMSEPVVKVNGKEAGRWVYGYSPERIDITKFVAPGDNLIEVHLTNVEESTRWYPGAGIYRPVTLILSNSSFIDNWHGYIRTIDADSAMACIEVCTKVMNPTGNLTADIYIVDSNGNTVAKAQKTTLDVTGQNISRLMVKSPKLWSPETPWLYSLVTKIHNGKKLIDETSQRLGIRTISVDAEHGFRLNGVSRKFKGVCLHHDLGPFGAAINKAALIRQVRILKEMGCDAIRTSHNIPSTMQMEVCDSMGMMVMAESFDMWEYPKCKNGYARFFNEWGERDLTSLILNHRNHPSIVMWSIGNEIPEQNDLKGGLGVSIRLQNLCHKLDPTRPVTQGNDRAEDALAIGVPQVMDIPGFNYRLYKFDDNITKVPQGFLLGTETASTFSSRGVYKFPVEINYESVHTDGQCSSYDVDFGWWCNLPDDDFLMCDDRKWDIGQFVWTGFDYLGEPTPYDDFWPSRSSYFGICDLAGLPKDRYYLYRSQWRTDDTTIHLLPHWTWPGREGEITPVYCYTNYPEAELFINGKSQGRIHKTKCRQLAHDMWKHILCDSILDRYRLRWNNVRYEPGVIKVVVYDESGHEAGTATMRTAGSPAAIVAEADRHTIAPNGDLAFITVSMVDANGTLCPDADNQMSFKVSGAARFKTVCNGDATSVESFVEPTMKLFHGQLVVSVEAFEPGIATLTISTPGLPDKAIDITVR